MFGAQTVTFVAFTLSSDSDDLGIHTETPVETDVVGCHFRPLTVQETAQTEFDIATEVWKCTAPPTAATLSADPSGYLRYGGDTFAIVAGAQPHTDFTAQPFKVTVLAQKQTG